LLGFLLSGPTYSGDQRSNPQSATHRSRSEFLRNLTSGGERIPFDPAVFLGQHLDETWRHLLTRWLVLRSASDDRSRIERRIPERWWRHLADARGLNGEAFGPVRDLKRRGAAPKDSTLLLRQARGLLVSVAAANGGASLEDTLTAFGHYMREAIGERGFAERVAARCQLWTTTTDTPSGGENRLAYDDGHVRSGADGPAPEHHARRRGRRVRPGREAKTPTW
jgi:hypothetical protein